MKLNELKAALSAAPAATPVRIVLPDGTAVPSHFHLTEVGQIEKRLVDCGGRRRRVRTGTLQVWMSSERDDGHRLTAGRFASILEIAAPLFLDEAVPVEVEYEAGLISQFPLAEGELTRTGDFVLRLESKHTDCRARESCGVGPEEEGCGCAVPTAAAVAARCC